jgi:hypothetical protein
VVRVVKMILFGCKVPGPKPLHQQEAWVMLLGHRRRTYKRLKGEV